MQMLWEDCASPLTAQEQRLGQQLLEDVRSVPSLNAFLFNHLRHLLLPPGSHHPLPLHTKINTTKVTKDGRALQLYIGILFHCMGYHILECGGGRGDGGVDVKARSPEGEIIVVQCKQYSKHIVGSDVGHQLIGTMFVNECNTGLLVSCSNVSKDVKTLTKVLKTVREGVFKVYVWEGDALVRMFGKHGQHIVEKRDAMLREAQSNALLQQYLAATTETSGHLCVMHSLSSPEQCKCVPLTTLDSPRPSPLLEKHPSPHLQLQPTQHRQEQSRQTSAVCLQQEEALELISDSDEDEETHRLASLSDCSRSDALRNDTEPWCPDVAAKIATPRAATTSSATVLKTSKVNKWTNAEEMELRRGIDKWGEGSWTEILDQSVMLKANGKTNVNIRNKWRNMQRKDIRAMTPNKHVGDLFHAHLHR